MKPASIPPSRPSRLAAFLFVAFLVPPGGEAASAQQAGAATTIEFEGWLEPVQTVGVSSSEQGVIVELAVALGEEVAQGQRIARLDDELQRAQLESARQRAEAQGQLNYARAEARLRRARLEQLRRLLEDGAARPEEISRAAAECELADAQLLTQQEEAAARRLDLQRAELALRRRTILAPLSGVVSEIHLRQGEYLSPIRSDVIQLIQVDQLIGGFTLPLARTKGFMVDRETDVRMESGEVIRVRVDVVGPRADAASGTAPLRVLVSNPQRRWRPGERCYLLLDAASSLAETQR